MTMRGHGITRLPRPRFVRKRGALLLALLGAAMILLPAIASSEVDPTITAENKPGVGGYYGESHAWSPAHVTVEPGGIVTLSNTTKIEHGVRWVGGPETPSCGAGVPVGTTPAAAGIEWSGTCTFTKPGVYTFYCTVHGPEMTGTITVPGTPAATTETATEVTQTGATLHGVVHPEGNTTSYYFEYGTSGLEHKAPVTPLLAGADFTAHRVTASLTGLSPNTEYHVELVAAYGTSSTVLGGEQVLDTPPTRAPQAVTGSASAITQTGATLGGAVSPEGLATTYYFRYGLSTSYEHQTSPATIGPEGAAQQVSAAIGDLAPDTLYHFQLVAENAAASSGPVAGADVTLTTASSPPPPPLSPSSPGPAPTPSATPASTPAPIASTLTAGPVATAPASPFAGGLTRAVKLTGRQHGRSVHGSIAVSAAGAGGRLEVSLLASGASLAVAGHRSQVVVGRFSRASLKPGVVTFVVPVSAKAVAALRRRGRLTLTIKIVLTPVHGAPVTVTRSVVLSG